MPSRYATSASSQEDDMSVATLHVNINSLGLNNILSRDDKRKFNCAIQELLKGFKTMPPSTCPFFCCIYLIGQMKHSYISSDLKEKMFDIVKEMAKVVKSLAEAECRPPCPELSQDDNGNKYLSLRVVGRLVIDNIFPNASGTFTQHALIYEIGLRVANAVRSQAGRGPIGRVPIRKYDGSTFMINMYLESDYIVVFKTIYDWMMTWKDNKSSVETYIAFN